MDEKFCKDCKFIRHTFWGIEWARCLKVPDLVSGKAGKYCSIMRDYDCGKEGNLFESKKSDKG